MTQNHNDVPIERFQDQFDYHTGRLSVAEIKQLHAVLGTYMERLSEPQYCERHPGFSLSVVLREAFPEPSEPLIAAVAMLEQWIGPTQLPD